MPGPGSKASLSALIIALTLAVLLAALDGTIVATALPTIVEKMKNADAYAWVGSVYLLAVTALLPIWGTLSDVWGRKMAILLANGFFFIGSLLCALSTSMGMLIAGRAIQGVGSAGLVLLVNVILSDLFPIKERAKYMGLTNTSWAVAAAIGPLIGGAFAQNVTWRWCFYLNLPLNGVVFLLLVTCLHIEQQKARFVVSIKSIDWIGVLLILGGTVMLLLGLQFGAGTHPWSSAVVLCLIIFGVIMMVTFIFVEWVVEKHLTQRPIVPISLIKDRSVLSTLVCFWVHGIIGIAPYYFLPLFFQTARGATPLLSGVYILPMVVTTAVTTMATGIFAQATGYIVEPIWAGFVLTTLGLGLFIDLNPQSSWAKLVIYQLIFGIGLGPNYSAPLLAVQRVVQPKDIATATSTLAFSRQLGSALSLVVGGIIFQSLLRGKLPTLVATLGPEATQHFSVSNAEASAAFINSLEEPQKQLVQKVYADSMRPMYYVYVALSALALASSFFIERGKLADEFKQEPRSSGDEKQEKGIVEANQRSEDSVKEIPN